MIRFFLQRGSPFIGALLLLVAAVAGAQEASPIRIMPEIRPSSSGPQLLLHFQVPPHNHLYADRLSLELAGQAVKADLPPPTTERDPHENKMVGTYLKDFTVTVPLPLLTNDLRLGVNLQGCDDAQCYFPEQREWIIHPDQTVVAVTEPDTPTAAPAEASAWLNGFTITGRATGFLGENKFLAFLNNNDGSAASGSSASGFGNLGVWATVGLILLGGLALNLTPCVLPMIPINLAILGAGVNGGNRRRGVALGGAYGLGMALAYGGLGLGVVLTGAKFGTLNASPWFNFAIAGVFVVLGLAMFDRIAIDFSRFQRAGGPQKSGNMAFASAAIMGAVSALLAGACVAPVVISVLLLATTSYQQGNLLGLLYPFVLGLGMALPWPFAAGGLSFLPKPGRWMTRVKYAFGLVIFAFAFWYGWLGWGLIHPATGTSRLARDSRPSLDALRTALATSRSTGQPVFVDFWAGWCKNCEAMELDTFPKAKVRERLNDFLVVRFQADRLDDVAIKPVLDEFGVLGLPTFVLVRPESAPAVATRTIQPQSPVSAQK